MWTKPAATEMRFGFEVTMYIMNKQCILHARFGPLMPVKKGPTSSYGWDLPVKPVDARVYERIGGITTNLFRAVKPTLEDVVSNEFFGFLRYM